MSTRNKKPELSIVLPVFNEEKNIPILLERCKKVADKHSVEFLLVEDTGSTDGTRKAIQAAAKKYTFIKAVLTSTRGYGASIYAGLQRAQGTYIGWAHADLQTDPNDAVRALSIIKAQQHPEKTYVKGKRYGRPLADRFFTFGMSVFETLILKKGMYDINAQPNVFHRSFLQLMKNPPSDFSFDLYAYYLAKKNGYNFIRFPVHFGKRLYGHSAWNFGFASRIKFIKRTLNFSFRLKKQLQQSRHN